MCYMRTIVNISLPADMAEEIKREMKKGGFATVSEYIRFAIRYVREDKLMKEVRTSKRQFSEGKSRTLSSLKDLR